MARIKDVMEQMRKGGYGSGKPKQAEPESSRSFELSEDEIKSLPEADENGEVCLMVYGKVSDGEFQVSRVEAEEE